MTKLPRLGVFGVLNYEMLSNMPDDPLCQGEEITMLLMPMLVSE